MSALEDRFEHLSGIRGAIVAAMLARLWVRNGGWLEVVIGMGTVSTASGLG